MGAVKNIGVTNKGCMEKYKNLVKIPHIFHQFLHTRERFFSELFLTYCSPKQYVSIDETLISAIQYIQTSNMIDLFSNSFA